MNRWRKLLVLLLLCVTMPLQAMAALRTHCAPGTPASATGGEAAAMMAMQHAMMSAMPDTPHATQSATLHRAAVNMADATVHGNDSMQASMSHQMADHGTPSQDSHNHHTRCSACAACVVCTALPQSVVLRLPDAQPSTAIPFLRTSAASAIVAVPERPPKALIA